MTAPTPVRRVFKTLAVLLAIAVIGPASASAQRFSITPFGGYLRIDPILRHDTQFNGFYTISSSHEELVLSNANVFGAELALWRVRGWQVFLDGGYASSRLRYRYATSIINADLVGVLPPATTEQIRGDIAKILVLGAGLQRRFDFLSLGLMPKLGLGLTQLQLPKRNDYCTLGSDCGDRWDSRYNVPSIVLGFDLRSPSFSSVSAVVSAKLGVGRLDTSGFPDHPPPDSFLYEAPSSRWLYTRQVLFGIAINL
jgi:hypothetical protein